MKGFKDSTKTQSGHGAGRATKEHWSVPIARKAMGGIVAPMPGGAGRGMSMSAARPIMPRPRVMPNMKPPGAGKMAKLAKGGRYTSAERTGEGASLVGTGPYSDNEAAHPTPRARPGYKAGGKTKGFNSKPMFGKDC